MELALVKSAETAVSTLGDCPVTKVQIDAIVASATKPIVTVDDMAERQKVLPLIKAAKKQVEAWIGPAKAAVKTVADTLQIELKSRVDPLDTAERAAKSEILRFEDMVRRQNEEARRRAEAETRKREEEARKLAAEAEAKLAEDDIMPWEAEAAVKAAEVVVPVVAEQIALPVAAGVGVRNLPWTAEVEDPIAFLKWVIADFPNRSEFISFNMPPLNIKARSMGEDISKIIPGVKAVRKQTIASR